MKITFLIDSLGSGGAQRQMCILAGLLKKRGHGVTIVKYHEENFFLPTLEAQQIPVETIVIRNKVMRLVALRKKIRQTDSDVVISFLNGPNLIAELSGIPGRRFSLIVSERCVDRDRHAPSTLARLLLHRLSDIVVVNSHAQTEFITSTAPWLRTTTETITNCVDLEHFRPPSSSKDSAESGFKILVIGRFSPQKNALGLVDAMSHVRDAERGKAISIDWYGNDFFHDGQPTKASEYYLKVHREIRRRSLDDRFRLHRPVADVARLYRDATALCMPSLWEGFCNVLCEGLACGKAIVASDVGDNARMVRHGENGFLCDPTSPLAISNAIIRLASTPVDSRRAMEIESRKIAEELLSPAVFERRYNSLIERLISDRRSASG